MLKALGIQQRINAVFSRLGKEQMGSKKTEKCQVAVKKLPPSGWCGRKPLRGTFHWRVGEGLLRGDIS